MRRLKRVRLLPLYYRLSTKLRIKKVITQICKGVYKNKIGKPKEEEVLTLTFVDNVTKKIQTNVLQKMKSGSVHEVKKRQKNFLCPVLLVLCVLAPSRLYPRRDVLDRVFYLLLFCLEQPYEVSDTQEYKSPTFS